MLNCAREVEIKGNSPAFIITALRPRTGATQLARAFVEYFVLSHEKPRVFDTDMIGRSLWRYFPHLVTSIDLDRVQGEMALFDTLVCPGPEKRVVEVNHRSFHKFFNVMQKINYFSEARLRGVQTVVFYIASRDRDSYEQGRSLRDHLDCPLVVVENAFFGEPNERVRRSTAYAALKAHPLRMHLPPIDPFVAHVIADPNVSLSAFLHQEFNSPLVYVSRLFIRAWIMKMFKEIHLILDALQSTFDDPG